MNTTTSRLPDATHVGRVRLAVSDLARSTEFYREVLGLRQVGASAGIVQLGPARGGRVLVELSEQPGARPVPRRGRLGLYHFAILLPDRAALGQFVRHLATRDIHAGMSDHLVSEAIYLSDPDGLGIEVYADRPRSSWQYAGKEIVMSTEPLDVADLVSAAGDAAWAGAPEGTVMGHVHLFVRDIEEGARFYHAGLGLDKTVTSYPGALFLSAGGYHHHVGINTWAAEAAAPTDADARLLEWRLEVPDTATVDAIAGSMRSAGFAVQRRDGQVLSHDSWGTAVRVAASAPGHR